MPELCQQGYETKVLVEHTESAGLFGTAIYERIACFPVRREPMRLQWVVEKDGTITGFIALSASERVPFGFLDDRPKETLICP